MAWQREVLRVTYIYIYTGLIHTQNTSYIIYSICCIKSQLLFMDINGISAHVSPGQKPGVAQYTIYIYIDTHTHLYTWPSYMKFHDTNRITWYFIHHTSSIYSHRFTVFFHLAWKPLNTLMGASCSGTGSLSLSLMATTIGKRSETTAVQWKTTPRPTVAMKIPA